MVMYISEQEESYLVIVNRRLFRGQLAPLEVGELLHDWLS